MSTMEIAESALLHCLSLSLRPTGSAPSLPSLTEREWAQVLALADRHQVLPLLETVLGDVELPPALRSAMEWKFDIAQNCFQQRKNLMSKTDQAAEGSGHHSHHAEGLRRCKVLSGSGISEDIGY